MPTLKALLIVSLFGLSLPAFCCKPPPPATPWEEGELSGLMDYINSRYAKVDSSSNYYSFEMWGYEGNRSVSLEFEPHSKRDGAMFFYSLNCSSNERKWSCDDLLEKRALSNIEGTHYIEIVDSLPSAEAQEVVAFLYGLAVSLEDSHEIIDELDKALTLENVNNIESIAKNDRVTYLLMVTEEAQCTRHEIIVQRFACGLEKCALKLFSNRKWGYP
jgi:hypothetical protein